MGKIISASALKKHQAIHKQMDAINSLFIQYMRPFRILGDENLIPKMYYLYNALTKTTIGQSKTLEGLSSVIEKCGFLEPKKS